MRNTRSDTPLTANLCRQFCLAGFFRRVVFFAAVLGAAFLSGVFLVVMDASSLRMASAIRMPTVLLNVLSAKAIRMIVIVSSVKKDGCALAFFRRENTMLLWQVMYVITGHRGKYRCG
jgi:hypothetical protein